MTKRLTDKELADARRTRTQADALLDLIQMIDRADVEDLKRFRAAICDLSDRLGTKVTRKLNAPALEWLTDTRTYVERILERRGVTTALRFEKRERFKPV